MWPRILVCFAWIILGWGVATNTTSAMALPAERTVVKPVSPLIITAYSTCSNGLDIDFIELYNDGSVPVRLSDWSIRDNTNDRNLSVIKIDSGELIEPGRHVIVAQIAAIDDYAYEVVGWESADRVAQKITKLSLENNMYRAHEVTLDPVKYVDQPMMRSMGVDGYLSSFKNERYRSFFNDPLYGAPTLPEDLEITEILAYARNDCTPLDNRVTCGDYVKLHNRGKQALSLDGLALRTDSYSSGRSDANTILLGGELKPDEYKPIYLTDSDKRLSLNNSGGYIWLEDKWGVVPAYASTLTSYPGAGTDQRGFAYSHDQGEWTWVEPSPFGKSQAVAPMLGSDECPTGKYRSPETGRCRTIEEAVNSLAMCAEGEERNPATNRCRKVAAKTSTLTPCGEGQERNPATNRCRSIASAVAEMLPCDEGYERSPTTNRCRKIQSLTVPDANFPVQPVAATAQTKTMWSVAGVIIALLIGYAGWEWRSEIGGAVRGLIRKDQ